MKIIKTLEDLEKLDRNVKVTVKQIYADPLINLKKYSDAFNSIGPSLDKNGFPVTGLTEDISVPGKAPIDKKVKGTREAMEKMLDLPAGTLKQSSSYWNTYFVKIGNDALELDLMSNHDLLQYLFLCAQSNVAKGVKDIESNANHEYVISSEEQEAAVRVKGRQNLKDAYKLADDLDLETKINILAVYGEIADATNPNSIIDRIDDKIELDPKKFLDIAKDNNLIYLSLITKALDKGVLIIKDGAVLHNEIMLGHSKESAAEAVAKDNKLETIIKAKMSGDMDIIKKALSKQNKELVSDKK